MTGDKLRLKDLKTGTRVPEPGESPSIFAAVRKQSSTSSLDSQGSGDIQAAWRKQEKSKRENAMLMMQGNVRYKHEDETAVHKTDQKHAAAEQFSFDPEISAQERFIDFKANVIGRSFKNDGEEDEKKGDESKEKTRGESKKSTKSSETGKNSVVDNYVRKQVLKTQQGKAFPSKEARRLDIVFKEVGILST